MEGLTKFFFEGKEYTATIHLSLQDEGCYIFSFLNDKSLILRFGTDIDFQTDCTDVTSNDLAAKDLMALRNAILEAAKTLPEFKRYNPKKLIVKGRA